jgi:tRNA threonylcarbamoyladenosine biosynthesis protein TsaB
MSLILNIDTALETAMVSISRDGTTLQFAISHELKDHAAWMHPAIEKIMRESGIAFHDLQAIAVSIGPGSYTGLRAGLSAAKGFCYALQIPLITITSLRLIAASVKQQANELICPLIDARRMEVYAAVYDKELNEILPPHARIVDASSFSDILEKKSVVFSGNGCKKLMQIIPQHKNAYFSDEGTNPATMGLLSYNSFKNSDFAPLAWSEPLYLKEFYSTGRKD